MAIVDSKEGVESLYVRGCGSIRSLVEIVDGVVDVWRKGEEGAAFIYESILAWCGDGGYGL